MKNRFGFDQPHVGYAAMAGGALGLLLAPWLAWSFLLVFPSAVVASTTVLPTTPSGALWLFSVVMIACGYFRSAGRYERLAAA